MNPSECLAKAAGEAVLLKDMFEILCARGGKKKLSLQSLANASFCTWVKNQPFRGNNVVQPRHLKPERPDSQRGLRHPIPRDLARRDLGDFSRRDSNTTLKLGFVQHEMGRPNQLPQAGSAGLA